MPRRNRYSRRRNRGRFSFLYKALTFLVICAAIAVALTLFFKVETIEITGNTYTSTSKIQEASGISAGDNLFLLNKYTVASNITENLPYIQSVQLSRKLPSTISIIVEECHYPGAIELGGKLYLISEKGKVIDCVSTLKAAEYYSIEGIELIAPEVGKNMYVKEDATLTKDTLLELLSLMSQRDILQDLKFIDVSDNSMITFGYTDRFTVRLNWNDDYAYRLDYLSAVIERLEVNEVGTIDLTQTGKASFIPAK